MPEPYWLIFRIWRLYAAKLFSLVIERLYIGYWKIKWSIMMLLRYGSHSASTGNTMWRHKKKVVRQLFVFTPCFDGAAKIDIMSLLETVCCLLIWLILEFLKDTNSQEPSRGTQSSQRNHFSLLFWRFIFRLNLTLTPHR